ncbi:hypothetical protein ACVNPX_10865 [Staphylococcus aureus]
MNYQVLLYYKYMTIDDPEQFAQDHLAFCKAHHLKGRILVSTEGINGTLSGTKEETDKNTRHICMPMNDSKIWCLKLMSLKDMLLRKCMYVLERNRCFRFKMTSIQDTQLANIYHL